MPLNLFLIGPPNSGKATLGKLIADKYNLTLISLSQAINDEITAGSGFGFEAKKYLTEERSIPDDLLFDILLSKLKTVSYTNFIISGYPKTLSQSRVMEFYFRKNNFALNAVISLGCDDMVKDFFTNKNKFIEVKSNSDESITFKLIVSKLDKIK